METAFTSVKLNSGYYMPTVGLGTYNFKQGEISKAVKCAVRNGYRLIDTAWVYQSEEEVGEGIKEVVNSGIVRREDLFITSKLWGFFHAPARVEVPLRESLADLQMDYVDLYLMHWPMAFKEPENKRIGLLDQSIEPEDTDFIDTWRAMETLVDKGLAKSIGVSNFNIAQLQRLLSADNLRYKPANHQLKSQELYIKKTTLTVLKIEINPYITNSELLAFCVERGITVTAYTPLAKGGIKDERVPDLLAEEILKKIGQKYNKTTAQVALRWGIQRGYSVIPKSITASRIQENIQIFDFNLSDEEMNSISSLNCNSRIYTLDRFKDFPEYPFVLSS